jgi:hypothetical protein
MSVKCDISVRSTDITVRPVHAPPCWTAAHSTPGPRTTDGKQMPKSAGSRGGGTSRNGSGFAPVRCRSDHPVLSGPDRCLHRSWPGRMQHEASHIPADSTRPTNCRQALTATPSASSAANRTYRSYRPARPADTHRDVGNALRWAQAVPGRSAPRPRHRRHPRSLSC